MRELPPGFIRTSTPLAAALIAMSVLPLPAPSRDRWRDEYRSEIVGLPRTRQIAEAASALVGAVNLRSAVKAPEGDGLLIPTMTWSCRIGFHHYRTVNQDNPEYREYRYRECSRCGNIKEADSADFPRTERAFMGGSGLPI